MSIVRTLRILASQRPSLPPRALAAPRRVARRRHGNVPVTWIDADLSSTATIVHLHGGSYVAGEETAHWEWLEEVGRRSGAATAMVHYRLAPTYPYPAAIEDVLHAIDAMGEQSPAAPRALGALRGRRRRGARARRRPDPRRRRRGRPRPAAARFALGGPHGVCGHHRRALPCRCAPVRRRGPCGEPPHQPAPRRPRLPAAGSPGHRHRGSVRARIPADCTRGSPPPAARSSTSRRSPAQVAAGHPAQARRPTRSPRDAPKSPPCDRPSASTRHPRRPPEATRHSSRRVRMTL